MIGYLKSKWRTNKSTIKSLTIILFIGIIIGSLSFMSMQSASQNDRKLQMQESKQQIQQIQREVEGLLPSHSISSRLTILFNSKQKLDDILISTPALQTDISTVKETILEILLHIKNTEKQAYLEILQVFGEQSPEIDADIDLQTVKLQAPGDPLSADMLTHRARRQINEATVAVEVAAAYASDPPTDESSTSASPKSHSERQLYYSESPPQAQYRTAKFLYDAFGPFVSSDRDQALAAERVFVTAARVVQQLLMQRASFQNLFEAAIKVFEAALRLDMHAGGVPLNGPVAEKYLKHVWGQLEQSERENYILEFTQQNQQILISILQS